MMVERGTADPQVSLGSWRMDRIMQEFPSAHRALADSFGVLRLTGECAARYQPDDTLAEVAASHGVAVADIVECFRRAHERAQELEVTVQETAKQMRHGGVAVLDVREPRAFDMAHVPGSRRIDQALAREIVQDWPRTTPIVLVCHHGMRSLDAVEFFRAQGFANTKSLRGGVDAWSVEIDPSVPRY